MIKCLCMCLLHVKYSYRIAVGDGKRCAAVFCIQIMCTIDDVPMPICCAVINAPSYSLLPLFYGTNAHTPWQNDKLSIYDIGTSAESENRNRKEWMMMGG